MKKVLLIDNYDSFTYNLLQAFRALGVEVVVALNDQISVADAQKLNPDFLVFSPGPGSVDNPKDIGIGFSLFEHFRGKIPILGVCLGEQMIGKYFGAGLIQVLPAHGKRSKIKVTAPSALFKDLETEFVGMRYHSFVLDRKNFPKELKITAETDDSDTLIMAIENEKERIYGVQFHPESFATTVGSRILKNFLTR